MTNESTHIVAFEVISAETIGNNIITICNNGFSNKKPTIFHDHLIPLGARRAMSEGWDSIHIPGRNIRIIELNDVIVGAQGLVLDSQFRVIKETITQHSNAEIEDFIKRAQESSIIEYVQGKFLNLRKRGEQNYGHWLIECLPKFDYLQQLDGEVGILAPNLNNQMNLVVDASLKASGASPDMVILKMERKEIRRFKSLTIVDGLTHHGTYMAPQVVHFNERLRAGVKGAGMQKVLLLRDSTTRCISNIEHLTSALKKLGFSAVNPGQLDWDGQIAALKDANSIIGVMGAEMTNIVYANEGANILNIAPASMPDTFFHFLSVHKNQTYHEFRCKTEGPIQDRVSPMHVDVDEICEIVRSLSF